MPDHDGTSSCATDVAGVGDVAGAADVADVVDVAGAADVVGATGKFFDLAVSFVATSLTIGYSSISCTGLFPQHRLNR